MDGVEILGQGILVPQVQQTVAGLRRILETIPVQPLQGRQFMLVHVDAPAEAVQQHLERIQFVAEHFILLLDLSPAVGPTPEQAAQATGLLLRLEGFGREFIFRLCGKRGAQGGGEKKQEGNGFFIHAQKLRPNLRPNAACWETGLTEAIWYSGRIMAGATRREMSSSTSKSCIYEKTLASMT